MHDRFNAGEWLLDRHLDAGDGGRIAIRYQGETLTYDDVHATVSETSAALRGLGVRPEERVAMVMLDSVEFVSVFLGAMRIGAVPVAINPLLPGRDLGVIVADSRARVVVVSAARAESIADLLAGSPEVVTVVTTGDAADRTLAWGDFLAGGAAFDRTAYATWAESPGFWLCTSGSTGRPKLAMHRHDDIRVTCDTYARHVLDIGADDRCYSVGPMFHAYGLGNSLTFPFSVGASTVLEPTRPPTPQLVADIVTSERPTLFFCIPTFYAALNASALPDDTFASVRCGASAAEPLPAETFERFKKRFGVTVLDGIGSTEMLHIYLSNSQDALKPGTSGVPVPGYECRIVDENGDEQPPGEPGQLLVKGASAATGYWCRNETNRSTFEGEWMRTGDLYSRDDDGYFTYLGRVDDMLRVGGEWVSPAEVEGVLIEHPGVLEAAVVGERDDAGILRPVAYVIAAETESVDAEALTDLCRDRLAGYKRPRRYEMVESLPKTATGKIQRYKLRAG
jgi:benzoate-CoA ligase family protein